MFMMGVLDREILTLIMATRNVIIIAIFLVMISTFALVTHTLVFSAATNVWLSNGHGWHGTMLNIGVLAMVIIMLLSCV